MNATLDRDEEGALGDALVGLLGHLRGPSYEGLPPGSGEALHREADRFVRKLAEHLRYTEEVLFPALGGLEPGSSRDFRELEAEHRLLHLHARDLALQVKAGDLGAAYGVTRSFLAVLLDHLRRETVGVDRWVGSLDVLDARRLSRALLEGRDPGGLQDPPP